MCFALVGRGTCVTTIGCAGIYNSLVGCGATALCGPVGCLSVCGGLCCSSPIMGMVTLAWTSVCTFGSCAIALIPPLCLASIVMSPAMCCMGWIGLPCLIGGGFASLLGCNLTQPWLYPLQRTCFGSLCPPGDMLAIYTLCSDILCFGVPPSCGVTAFRTGLEIVVGMTSCGLVSGVGNTTCSSAQSLILSFCGLG
jgi:hypothetical protein